MTELIVCIIWIVVGIINLVIFLFLLNAIFKIPEILKELKSLHADIIKCHNNLISFLTTK